MLGYNIHPCAHNLLTNSICDCEQDKQDTLIASGSLALSDNTIAPVAKYSFTNGTWSAVGSTDLPGPVTALAVNNRNISSIFAAGRSVSEMSEGISISHMSRTYDGSSSFLSFWNGLSWTRLGNIGSVLRRFIADGTLQDPRYKAARMSPNSQWSHYKTRISPMVS